MSELRVRLVANAGVVVEMGGEKILVDALFTSREEGFSAPSPNTREAILAGGPPYDGVTALIVSHDHPDHFDATLGMAFLRRHHVGSIVLPGSVAEAYPDFKKLAEERSKRLVLLGVPQGYERTVHLGEVALTALSVPHAAPQFAGVEHYAFLLAAGGRSLLLLADSDYLPELFAGMLSARRPDTILANPLFLNKPKGRQVLLEAEPQKLLVYHLPFEGEDTLGLRKAARHDSQKYAAILPPVELLLQEGQAVSL